MQLLYSNFHVAHMVSCHISKQNVNFKQRFDYEQFLSLTHHFLNRKFYCPSTKCIQMHTDADVTVGIFFNDMII